MRVDREGGEIGFFDNVDDRPIHEKEWGYYEITGDMEKDAERISIGLLLYGSGKAWIDDGSFQVLGDTPAPEPARPLTPQGLRNEVAFSRLYGLVHYFHPSDQAAQVDWNGFVIQGVREVESAKNDAALARKLALYFPPLRPQYVYCVAKRNIRCQPTCFHPRMAPRQRSLTGTIAG